MKSFIILCTIAFSALFIVGHTPNLEAKHHNRFSFNIGTFFPGPAYVAAPVYPAPAYVERRVYMDPYGYPMYESMYMAPRPYQPVYVSPPPVWTGFSFGARFR